MTDFVMQGRGKVLDEIYVPLQPKPQDFEKVIKRIKQTVTGCDFFHGGRAGHLGVL